MKQKVYISGKITGLPINQAKIFFENAEKYLKNKGFSPVNPMKLIPVKNGKTWEQYMRDDIKLLMDCDFIYMLPNWQDSKGAKLELAIAEAVGIHKLTTP